ncbi:MAG: hypothetical protein Q8L55_01525, partial [Phycisphaerales bacterium]|nr:hypothetical protein [Phycisphaerales bacterium]
MKSTVFFAALTALVSACAGQTYSVTLRDGNGTLIGSPNSAVASGGSVTLTSTAFGTPTLTLSQMQSVRRIDVEATVVGGVTASIGTVD